VLNVNNIGLVQ